MTKLRTLSLRQQEESVYSMLKMLPDRRRAGASLCMTNLGALSLRQQEESVHPMQICFTSLPMTMAIFICFLNIRSLAKLRIVPHSVRSSWWDSCNPKLRMGLSMVEHSVLDDQHRKLSGAV